VVGAESIGPDCDPDAGLREHREKRCRRTMGTDSRLDVSNALGAIATALACITCSIEQPPGDAEPQRRCRHLRHGRPDGGGPDRRGGSAPVRRPVGAQPGHRCGAGPAISAPPHPVSHFSVVSCEADPWRGAPKTRCG
jgi:hypothetical protein